MATAAACALGKEGKGVQRGGETLKAYLGLRAEGVVADREAGDGDWHRDR